MNHLPLIIEKLKEFQSKLPGYSVGNILYSAIEVEYKGKSFTKGDLCMISDKELYGLLSRSFLSELVDQEEEDQESEN